MTTHNCTPGQEIGPSQSRETCLSEILAELSRLRAVNTELVEALEKLARLGNGNEYGNSGGNMIARAALSSAEQAKPTLDLTKAEWADEERASIEQKPETCVWNYNPAGVWNAACGVVCIGLEAMTFCPGCNKRVEVKG